MRFTKMHGLGNDYIYVNSLEERPENTNEAARILSDRHFGIGSDGLILICPSDQADFRMEMYNADGSRGKMCGNGIRCVGKYVYDHRLTGKTTLKIETDSGIRTLFLETRDGLVEQVTVDMGPAIMEPEKIPVAIREDLPRILNYPITAAGGDWNISCVSVGSPHCTVQVADPEKLDLSAIGPVFEHLPIFPDRINTEFYRVDSPTHVTMRVWERGSGETMACGTGSCAVGVTCMLLGLTQRRVTVGLRGGDLEIAWENENEPIWMKGPATTVFEGDVDWKTCRVK